MCKEDLSNTSKWDKSKLLLVVLAVAIALAIVGTFKGIADFIVGMAWPVVVCTAFWYLRPAIVRLIDRIKKIGAGNFSAEIGPLDQSQTVAKAEEEKPLDTTEKYIQENPKEIAGYIAKLVADNHSLLTFSWIYGSQVRCLDYLYKTREQPTKAGISFGYYEEHVRDAGHNCLTYTIWRNFLEEKNLIETGQDKLTQYGEQFIEYIRQVYPKKVHLNRPW